MELIGFIRIYCFYCFLTILDAGSAPTCLVYHITNENAADLRHHTLLCSIKHTNCSKESLYKHEDEDRGEPEVNACVSEEHQSCMLSWTIQGTGLATSVFMTLAVREYDIASSNKGEFQCYNVSMEAVMNSAHVTVVLNLRPLVGLASVLETSVIYHLGAKESSTLFRNTLIRDVNKSSCNTEDPCMFSPIIKRKSMACDGDTTRVEVEAWTVGVTTRLIQLQWNNISKDCHGIEHGNCSIHFEVTGGGGIELKMRVTLADNSICDFIKTIVVKYCGDAVYDGSISFPTSFNTSKTPPTFSSVPHYVIVVFVLAIAVTFSVLVTIVFAIYNSLKRIYSQANYDRTLQNNEHMLADLVNREDSHEDTTNTDTYIKEIMFVPRTDHKLQEDETSIQLFMEEDNT